jgi:hypothetical protein
MDNRRKKNPEVYRHYNPVHLEYEDEAYRALLHKMKALNHATPEAFLSELVKEMVSNNMISFFLNTEQENVLKYVLNFQYPDHNFQEALKTWVVTRSEKEAIAIKKGRMKR